MRPWVPLLIVLVVIVILLIGAFWFVTLRPDKRREERYRAFEESDQPCHERNPRTGWVCERYKYHTGPHWQTIHGEKYDWNDD